LLREERCLMLRALIQRADALPSVYNVDIHAVYAPCLLLPRLLRLFQRHKDAFC